MVVIGQHSLVTGHCYPSDIIDFAMLPAQRFWQETVSVLDVTWSLSNHWQRALLGKKFPAIEHIHSRGRHLCKGTKEFFFTKKRVQLPQDLFWTPIWLPFHSLFWNTNMATVNTLYVTISFILHCSWNTSEWIVKVQYMYYWRKAYILEHEFSWHVTLFFDWYPHH